MKRRAPKTEGTLRDLIAVMRSEASTRAKAGHVPEFQVALPDGIGQEVRQFIVRCTAASGQRVTKRIAIGLLVRAGLEALGPGVQAAAMEGLREP